MSSFISYLSTVFEIHELKLKKKKENNNNKMKNWKFYNFNDFPIGHFSTLTIGSLS